MAGHRADKVASLIEESARQPPAEREAWLRKACSGDGALLARVRDAMPTWGDASEPLSPLATPAPAVPRSLIHLGPYTLRGVLGEGTFGVVYLGEQKEPVPRRVAVKLIKPGMDSQRILARFASERQVLALFDHPSLAHILDSGTTEDGRPWFAMEYVAGLPVHRWCDQARLQVPDRLRLMIQVCDAMQHAHQKGVVHRDLKPGNILVSSTAAAPLGGGTAASISGAAGAIPKIIDFGVAKALFRAPGESPAETEPGQLMGTLEYMSPEQAIGRGAEIDTRSDIYSLGAILYELLTGSIPLQGPAGDPAAFVERLQRDDAVAPSARVAAEAAADPGRAREVAVARGTTPAALARALRGDLDWIVMKCLAKEPSRRYDSAGELARDLARHLEHRPVLARPPSVIYHFNRFVRRHQAAAAAALVCTGTLAVAATLVVASLLAALRERDAARAAERQLAEETLRAERASEAASDATGALMALIAEASLDRTSLGAAATPRDVLDAARRDIVDAFRDMPLAQSVVRIALGKAFLSLEDAPTAAREFEAAAALLGALGPAGRDQLVDARLGLAGVHELTGDFPAAQAAVDAARAIVRAASPPDPMDAASVELAQARLCVARSEGACALDAVARGRTAAAGIADAAAKARTISSLSFFEAQADILESRWSDALTAIEGNLAFNREVRPSHWWVAESEVVQAAALIGAGRVEEGRTLLAGAAPALARALPPGSIPRRIACTLVARAFQSRGLDADAAHWRSLGGT